MSEPRSGHVVSVNVNRGSRPEAAGAGVVGRPARPRDDRHLKTVPSRGGVSRRSASTRWRRSLASSPKNNAFPGAFGENLTLEGIELNSIRPGDRLTIGDGELVIEITWNAAPCYKQADWFSDGKFGRIGPRTHPENTRWYARVISEGPVHPETQSGQRSRPLAADLTDVLHRPFAGHSRSSTVR